MGSKGVLYLIPSTISEKKASLIVPEYTKQAIKHIDTFLVEDAKTARSNLKELELDNPIQELNLYEYSKNSKQDVIDEYIKLLKNGKDLGMLSEAGVPAVADPGESLILEAHQHNIKVRPLIGPSSLLLALTASGLNGENFSFDGYLPVEEGARKKRIKQLEKESLNRGRAEIFIEAPYRSFSLFQSLLECCDGSTYLCVASNITNQDEYINTKQIVSWKQGKWPQIEKIPTVFILQAGA